jgi:hypothetical protein
MKATKALGSKEPSYLYYISDIWELDRRTGCHDPSRYQDILYALPVYKDHVFYKNGQSQTCFESAWFGYYNQGYTLQEKRDYFKKAFHVTCSPSNKTRVTIINRKYRRILNADEMCSASELDGFDTSVVFLSKLTLKEQFNVIMCTDILVGFQGAGLRWIDFLPERSALLELTMKHWVAFYTGQAKSQNKNSDILMASSVVLNLPVYFHIVKNTSPNITKEFEEQYYQKEPESEFDNHWKWADANFDTSQFVQKLNQLRSSL